MIAASTAFRLICVFSPVCTCRSCLWWRTAAGCSTRHVGSVLADSSRLEKVAERCVACKLALPLLENQAFHLPWGMDLGPLDHTKGGQVGASGEEVDPLGLEASCEVVEAYRAHTS